MSLLSNTRVIVGVVYVSIMPDHCKQCGCDEVYIGLVEEAEEIIPAYDLIPNCDFCVIHASRGCIRRCDFCYTHKLEPKFVPKKSIKREIVKPNISFLDNNLLANHYIKHILKELINARINSSSCLCGVYAALVRKDITNLMFEANFRDVLIAFDRKEKEGACENVINYFEDARYLRKDIGVFAIYNFEDPFEKVEKRRILIKD